MFVNIKKSNCFLRLSMACWVMTLLSSSSFVVINVDGLSLRYVNTKVRQYQYQNLHRQQQQRTLLVPSPSPSSSSAKKVSLSSLWWSWIMPEIKTNPKSSNDLNSLFFRLPIDNVHDDSRQYLGIKKCISLLLSISLALGLSLSFSQGASAVSGGGLDYAGLDLTGQNFSNGNYKGKDFTQVIAKGTNFAKSNLQGCRFYKAYLVNADFTGADIRGASLEDTSMDGASLKDSIAVGSYFSVSILDTASVENADFTDAQFPVKALPLLCDREDMKGTNPTTGVDTRESAMCP